MAEEAAGDGAVLGDEGQRAVWSLGADVGLQDPDVHGARGRDGRPGDALPVGGAEEHLGGGQPEAGRRSGVCEEAGESDLGQRGG